jgi:uncharacterized protein (DUF302 family)
LTILNDRRGRSYELLTTDPGRNARVLQVRDSFVGMSTPLSTKLATRFDDAVAHIREAFAQQGFSVLTEIDVKSTLKTKLGADIEDYLILGACNPELAYRAISVDREIGLLLPCNVLVRTQPDDPGAVFVEAMDPGILVDVTGEPALKAIADEVTVKLGAAIASLVRSCG